MLNDTRERQLVRLIQAVADHAVVVKNPDIWASYRRGSDWDLAVRSLPDAYGRVVDVLGQPNEVVKRSYVWALDYGWMQFDLLPRLEWRGVPLVDASRLFAGRVAPVSSILGLPTARLAHQAMAACVYPAMAHGSVKHRYLHVWERAWADDGDELSALSREIFGADLLQNLTFADLPKAQSVLRRNAVARSVRRSPLATAAAASRFVRAESRLRLHGR